MTERKFPETHLGHSIGPAPTSEELGITLMKPQVKPKAKEVEGENKKN
jgi:hypothetical protein